MENLNINNVYNSYHKDVFNLVIFRLGQKNKELAEELTNDVFIKANKYIDDYDKEKSTVKTWLFVIATNLIKDQWRKKELNTLSIDDTESADQSQQRTPNFVNTLTNNSHTPYEILVNDDLGRKLSNAINSLPEVYKDLSIEFFVEQNSYEEIVQSTKLPIGTVKGKLFRARKLLQAALS